MELPRRNSRFAGPLGAALKFDLNDFSWAVWGDAMVTLSHFVWLAALALFLSSCSSQGTIDLRGKITVPYRYDNPHTACAHCHGTARPKGKLPLFPPGTDPSQYCLDCHKYSVNHHPVDFVPASPINPSFPLFSGEVKCLTCHQIHGGPDHKGSLGLLRGGPYAERRKVCFDCHTQELLVKINPHKMLDEEGKRSSVNGQLVCLLCHSLKPDLAKDSADTVLFNADIAFLCWRCHPQMHGDVIEKHFLVAPSDDFLATMKKAVAGGKFNLPLVPRKRITCTTCHNPHQRGVIPLGPAAAGADSLHRLRDANVCAGCHKN
jgi:hypothetical protein